MITYGYRPSIDFRIHMAESRLIRLQQLERDAKSVLTRRHNAYYAALQSFDPLPKNELMRLRTRRNQAYARLTSVQAEILEQMTVVRHLREGRE